MKSIIEVNGANKNQFCIVCTQRATKSVLLGKQWSRSISGEMFYLCNECAEKLAERLKEEVE